MCFYLCKHSFFCQKVRIDELFLEKDHTIDKMYKISDITKFVNFKNVHTCNNYVWFIVEKKPALQ